MYQKLNHDRIAAIIHWKLYKLYWFKYRDKYYKNVTTKVKSYGDKQSEIPVGCSATDTGNQEKKKYRYSPSVQTEKCVLSLEISREFDKRTDIKEKWKKLQ